jgi:EmrB/QacA subfamily drug resistance transporter
MSGQAQPERISGGTLLALLAMGISVIVLAQDISAVNVALPVVERHFDADLSTVQWVINAYALVLGMLIVPGGRLADQFGRKRVFLIGAGIFAATSFLAGIAPTIAWLIGARALMGIGGALMLPSILGMTYAALPASKAGLAGGLIVGAAGIGQGLGPITGGALTEFSWRWVQFINVPVTLFAMLVTWREIHQPDVSTGRERLDRGGIVALSLGLLALLLALDQAISWGWTDPRIVGLLAAFLVLGVAFVVIERRAGPSALVPGDVIGNRQFAASGVAMALVAPSFAASVLFLPQFLQKLLHYSPLEAGLGLLPQMGTFALVSFAGGWLYGRLGPKLMVSAGAGCMAVGVFLLSLLDSRSGYSDLVAGMVVLGVGLGLFFASVTTAAVQSVDPSRTSLAGGIIQMFQFVGGAIGLALTTMVVTLVSRARLNEELATFGASLSHSQALVLHGLLADTDPARAMLDRLTPAVAAQVTRVVADAFADGIRIGLRLDGLLALGAVVVAVLLIGRPVVGAGPRPTSHASLSPPAVPGDHEAPVRD